MDYALAHIRDAGCRAGLAVTPSTPLDIFGEVDVDLALVMSVNPGWGGQAFIRGPRQDHAAARDARPDVPIKCRRRRGRADRRPGRRCRRDAAGRRNGHLGAPDPAGAYARILAAAGGSRNHTTGEPRLVLPPGDVRTSGT